MSIFDYFRQKKNKKIIIDDKVVKEDHSIDDKVAKEEHGIDFNLSWQNEDNEHRTKDLIEYFCQCLMADNDETVLEHVNNIFAYRKNLEELFSDVNDNGITVNIFAILMEVLNSDNMYRKYYERFQEGIYELKLILKKIYVDKQKNKYSRMINYDDYEVESFVNKMFDINSKGKYSVKDFIDKYKDILNNSISYKEYDGSLFNKYYEKDALYYPDRDLFKIKIKNKETGMEETIDYKKMTSKEKFDFITNYIVASSMLNMYDFYDRFSIARWSVYLEQGSQNSKKEEKVIGNINDISLFEDRYKQTGFPFDPDPEEEYGSYSLSVKAEKGSYDLLTFMIRGFNEPNVVDASISEEGYNLNYQQFNRIIELLRDIEFEENGSLNITTYNFILPCMLGLLIYVNSMQSSKDYSKMKRDLSKLISDLKSSDINYFDTKTYKTINPDLSPTENVELSEYCKLEYLMSINPLIKGQLWADRMINKEAIMDYMDLRKALTAKYDLYNKTKEAAGKMYKEILNNLDELLDFEDGTMVKKNLDFYENLSVTHKEDDESKRL